MSTIEVSFENDIAEKKMRKIIELEKNSVFFIIPVPIVKHCIDAHLFYKKHIEELNEISKLADEQNSLSLEEKARAKIFYLAQKNKLNKRMKDIVRHEICLNFDKLERIFEQPINSNKLNQEILKAQNLQRILHVIEINSRKFVELDINDSSVLNELEREIQKYFVHFGITIQDFKKKDKRIDVDKIQQKIKNHLFEYFRQIVNSPDEFYEYLIENIGFIEKHEVAKKIKEPKFAIEQALKKKEKIRKEEALFIEEVATNLAFDLAVNLISQILDINSEDIEYHKKIHNDQNSIKEILKSLNFSVCMCDADEKRIDWKKCAKEKLNLIYDKNSLTTCECHLILEYFKDSLNSSEIDAIYRRIYEAYAKEYEREWNRKNKDEIVFSFLNLFAWARIDENDISNLGVSKSNARWVAVSNIIEKNPSILGLESNLEKFCKKINSISNVIDWINMPRLLIEYLDKVPPKLLSIIKFIKSEIVTKFVNDSMQKRFNENDELYKTDSITEKLFLEHNRFLGKNLDKRLFYETEILNRNQSLTELLSKSKEATEFEYKWFIESKKPIEGFFGEQCSLALSKINEQNKKTYELFKRLERALENYYSCRDVDKLQKEYDEIISWASQNKITGEGTQIPESVLKKLYNIQRFKTLETK